LLHHVRGAGGRPERLFADEALELLSRRTHGVPRLLNQAAHQALNLAAESGAAQVDVEAALEGLALLGLADEIDNAEPSPLSGAVFEEGEPMVDLDGTSGDESAAVEEENASHRLILGSGRAS
jgi:hypothetical protein